MAKQEKNLDHATPETVEELESLKKWWSAHGNAVTIAMIAILVAVIGVQQYGRMKKRAASETIMTLETARSTQAVEEIIAADKSSVATPLARLRLAAMYFSQEQHALAQSTYEEFLKKHPKHQMAPVAEVGLAHSLEATGKVDEAAEKFRAFVEANTNSYLTTTARLGLGRSLILAGKKDEGKAVLDLLITETAGSRWAGYADELARAKDRLIIPAAPASTDLSDFFSPEQNPAAILVEPPEDSVAVELPVGETPGVEAPVEEAPVEEAAAAAEEAPVGEEAPVQEAPAAKEAPTEETSVVEEPPAI